MRAHAVVSNGSLAIPHSHTSHASRSTCKSGAVGALANPSASTAPPLAWFTPASGLADLEARESGNHHAGLVQNGLDGLLRFLDRRLLQQHHVLEEAVHPALDDLGES